jgi:hypothetical protein
MSSPGHVFPPDPKTSYHETLAGKNVQRGLAAKLQDLSAAFRKKQRVYMESACAPSFFVHLPFTFDLALPFSSLIIPPPIDS